MFLSLNAYQVMQLFVSILCETVCTHTNTVSVIWYLAWVSWNFSSRPLLGADRVSMVESLLSVNTFYYCWRQLPLSFAANFAQLWQQYMWKSRRGMTQKTETNILHHPNPIPSCQKNKTASFWKATYVICPQKWIKGRIQSKTTRFEPKIARLEFFYEARPIGNKIWMHSTIPYSHTYVLVWITLVYQALPISTHIRICTVLKSTKEQRICLITSY